MWYKLDIPVQPVLGVIYKHDILFVPILKIMHARQNYTCNKMYTIGCSCFVQWLKMSLLVTEDSMVAKWEGI